MENDRETGSREWQVVACPRLDKPEWLNSGSFEALIEIVLLHAAGALVSVDDGWWDNTERKASGTYLYKLKEQ